ncbi:type 1 glutamine amidotransferase [Ancylobacter oerskovii]|uniref:Type 1 glutamine amidotransferase n=1 Tax=Ancylobacter oerskovii TaxID=459519 RepID=A0ABW4YZH6_9HYPH|nr:type 1 glutamine amidotransferase [Ancylobacter oerskovii]MBS7543900.1 type 1 glutamine amidotransferase [Ancylobacter oerskovii]
MSEQIRIGILKTGSAPEGLLAAQGDYDACFRRLLADEAFAFATYDIEHGLFPEGPAAADAWIITGSRHGVYEDHAWIAPLEQLIRDIQAAGRPLVGICFGHQIVAQALGGRVERAAGWIAGPQLYRDRDGNAFAVNAWHRDQVVELPPQAEVFASGEGCIFAGLSYPGPILTLQPHPEFGSDYVLGLLAERGATLPAPLQAHVETARTRSPDLGYLVPLLKGVLKGDAARMAAA